MRNFLVLLASTALTACGGAGTNSVGVNTPSSGGTPTTPTDPTVPGSGHSFSTPTEVKTYSAIGGIHSYNYKTSNDENAPSPGYQYGQLYAGNASTARDSEVSVTYNPRDAIFDLVFTDPLAKVEGEYRFQDPVHRTNFGGAREPQGGVPDLPIDGVQYLQAGASVNRLVYEGNSETFPTGLPDGVRDVWTFFYQKPGTLTKYVTFAGFVRNRSAVVLVEPQNAPSYVEQQNKLERGAFVFGERAANANVPTTGTASFSGAMIASMVVNPLLDVDRLTPTYFQWMSGTANTTVNFGAGTFAYSMNGTVGAPLFDVYTSRVFALQAGSTFTGAGSGRVDLVRAGGFLGEMSTAEFTQPNGTKLTLNIAGSSIDGAFYGPKAQEVGGGFRIVGGTPDQRIDLQGAFTGK